MEPVWIIMFISLVVFIVANLRNPTPPQKNPPRRSEWRPPQSPPKSASTELDRFLQEARDRRREAEAQRKQAMEVRQQQRRERQRIEQERANLSNEPPPIPVTPPPAPTPSVPVFDRTNLPTPDPVPQVTVEATPKPVLPRSANAPKQMPRIPRRETAGSELARMLHNADSLKAAMLLKEVLGDPVSRRFTNGRPPR